MIKVIFFDLGGVLLEKTISDVISEFIRNLGIGKTEFKNYGDHYKKAFLSGKISDKEFINSIRRKYNLDSNVKREWNDSYEKVMSHNKDLLALSSRLKGKYKIGILSNISKYHEEVHKKDGLFSYFDLLIIPSKVGFFKPEKGIFEAALREAKVKPRESIFTDDSLANLKTPKTMGFNVINFKSNDQFLEEIKLLGVSIN